MEGCTPWRSLRIKVMSAAYPCDARRGSHLGWLTDNPADSKTPQPKATDDNYDHLSRCPLAIQIVETTIFNALTGTRQHVGNYPASLSSANPAPVGLTV